MGRILKLTQEISPIHEMQFMVPENRTSKVEAKTDHEGIRIFNSLKELKNHCRSHPKCRKIIKLLPIIFEAHMAALDLSVVLMLKNSKFSFSKLNKNIK